MENGNKLWQDYREAWEDYSRRHGALQSLMESAQPEKSRVDAILETERARMEHSAARDRLAKHLNAELPPEAPAGSQEGRVRSTARLLWDMAGRPSGTAERDWLRAEKLVRAAAARSTGSGNS